LPYVKPVGSSDGDGLNEAVALGEIVPDEDRDDVAVADAVAVAELVGITAAQERGTDATPRNAVVGEEPRSTGFDQRTRPAKSAGFGDTKSFDGVTA
jgi:hypothetical protein